MKALYFILVFFFAVTGLFANDLEFSSDDDLIAYDGFSGDDFGWSGSWNKLYSYRNHYGVGNYWNRSCGHASYSNNWYYCSRYWYYWNDVDQPDFKYSKDEVHLRYSHSSGVSIDGGNECVKAINTSEGSQSSTLSRYIKNHYLLTDNFYVSFLAQFSEKPEKGWDFIAVGSKRNGLDAGVALGSIYDQEKIGAAFGRDGVLRKYVGRELPMANETYFVVAKFITNKYGTVVAIKLFVNPTSLTQEQSAWKAKVRSEALIHTMSSLDLQAYFHDVAYFDEIRVGSTWSSVVSPLNNSDSDDVLVSNITKFKGPTGYWKEKDKWTNGVPTDATDSVIIEGQCAVDDEVVAKDIVVEGSGKLVVVSGGKIKTNNPIVLKADKDVAAEYEQEDETESYVVQKQEYFPGGQWNFVCVPEAMTAAELFPDLNLASSWDDPAADYWLLDYSQELRAATKDGMKDIYDGDYPLVEGRGYIVWLDVDRVRTFNYTSSNNEISVSTTNSTSTTVSLNHSGWNLVGNPFSHSVSYEDVFDNCPHNQKYFNGAVYVWDGAAYKIWTNGVGDDEAREIAPMEAFFVKRTSDDAAAALFYMTDDATSLSVESSISSKAATVNEVSSSFSVSINLMKGDWADYTYLSVDESASLGLDENLDGLKLKVDNAYNDLIYTTDQHDIFAVNAVALENDYIEVPLVVDLAQGMDSILLGFSTDGNLDYSYALIDEDEMTITPVDHGDFIKCASGNESLIEGRFSIFVTRSSGNETDLVEDGYMETELGLIVGNEGVISVESLANDRLTMSIIGVNGGVCVSDVLMPNVVLKKKMHRGLYFVRLSNGSESIVGKVFVQ